MVATLTAIGELLLGLGAMALFLVAVVRGLTLVTRTHRPESRPFHLRRRAP